MKKLMIRSAVQRPHRAAVQASEYRAPGMLHPALARLRALAGQPRAERGRESGRQRRGLPDGAAQAARECDRRGVGGGEREERRARRAKHGRQRGRDVGLGRACVDPEGARVLHDVPCMQRCRCNGRMRIADVLCNAVTNKNFPADLFAYICITQLACVRP